MLSVLIATHNGADTIERTLAAMLEVAPPQGGWKLVVVNNASTDDTEARILKWRDRLPMEYLVEPRLGKAVAMNTAFQHTEGDFIVMTDDDVLPDRDWLVEWRRVADAYPQCTVFGGAITPEFSGRSPAWTMPDWCYTVLYGQTPAYEEGEIEPVNVCGGNMSLRRIAIDRGARFDESFMKGPRGVMGEDSDLVRRLASEGHKVGFAPGARVRHIIHERQTTRSWIRSRIVRHGGYVYLLEDARASPSSGQVEYKIPWWRLRRLAQRSIRLLITLFSRDKNKTISEIIAIYYDYGALWWAIKLKMGNIIRNYR